MDFRVKDFLDTNSEVKKFLTVSDRSGEDDGSVEHFSENRDHFVGGNIPSEGFDPKSLFSRVLVSKDDDGPSHFHGLIQEGGRVFFGNDGLSGGTSEFSEIVVQVWIV